IHGRHGEPDALRENPKYYSNIRILVRVHGNFLSKWRWKHQKQGQSHALTRTGSSPSVFPLQVSLLNYSEQTTRDVGRVGCAVFSTIMLGAVLEASPRVHRWYAE